LINLLKSIFRYIFNKKIWLIGLTFLLTLSLSIFISTTFLSQNLRESYYSLVEKGNLNDITIYERYASTYNKEGINLEGEEARKKNQEEFLKDIVLYINTVQENDPNFKISFNQSESLEIGNNNNNILFKIIKSDFSDEVNKLVINTGNHLPASSIDFNNLLIKASWDAVLDPNQTPAKMRLKLLGVVASSNWTDKSIQDTAIKIFNAIDKQDPASPIIIHSDIKNWQTYTNPDLIKLGAFIGVSQIVLKGFLNNFESWINPKGIGPTLYNPPSNIDFKMNFIFKKKLFGVPLPIPIVGYYEDFSNISAVIPDYSLVNFNKKVLPENLYSEYQSLLNKQKSLGNNLAQQSEFKTFFNKVPLQNKISVDNTRYLILGTGITPNYMYPIINFENSIPNPDNEMLVYTPNSGYERAVYSFRDNPTENYIVMSINSKNTTAGDINRQNVLIHEAINEINEMSIQYMAWPGEIKSTYLASDTNNFLSPAPLRLDFLPKLLDVQSGITISLTLFVLIGSFILCIFFVSKFIKDNKSVLGIMLANGLNRWYILLSVSIIGIIPSFISGVISFFIGTFTQELLFSIYDNFWFNTIQIQSFSVLWLLGLIFLPMIIMAVISVIVVFFKFQKQSVVEMMENNSEYRVSIISASIKKLFAHTPVLVRFRVSVAFASISKTIYITIMIAISTLMITMSASTTNIFGIAKTRTSDVKNYDYSFDLASPTKQGGQYFRSEPSNLGISIVNPKNEVLNNSAIRESDFAAVNYREWKGYDLLNLSVYGQNNFGLLGGAHFPSVNDASAENTNMLFLKNIVQHQTALDISIAGVNPFDIVSSLASVNILNIMDERVASFWNKAINDNRMYRLEPSNPEYVPIEPSNPEYVPEFYSQFSGLENPIFFNYEKVSNKTVAKSLIEANGTTTTNKPVFDFVSIEEPEIIDSTFAKRKFHINNAENPPQAGQPIWPKTGWYKVNKENLATTFQLQQFFVWFLTNTYLDPLYQDDLYQIIFNYVPMLKNDISYTYIDFESASLDKTNTQSFIAKGINLDKVIDPTTNSTISVPNLFNDVNKNLNEKLQLQVPEVNHPKNFKVLISESVKYKYDLKIGDKIKMTPKNHTDRYFDNSIIDYEFEVVDIFSSYYGDDFFINQDVANELLGYNVSTFNTNSYYIAKKEFVDNKWIITNEDIKPFNGFFSLSETHPILTSTSATYSYSGLYPAIDRFSHSEKFTSILNFSLKSQTSIVPDPLLDYDTAFYAKQAIMKALNYDDINKFNTYLNSFANPTLRNTDVLNQIINVYGSSVFSLMNKRTEVSNKTSGIFDTSENLIHSLETLLFAILISISLLTTLIMLIDLIENSLSVAASLKALGFSDRSNMVSFLSAFFPPLILGTILGFSLSSVFINFYISTIFSISSIYLPVILNPWLLLVSLVINGLMVLIILGYGVYKFKNDDITKYI